MLHSARSSGRLQLQRQENSQFWIKSKSTKVAARHASGHLSNIAHPHDVTIVGVYIAITIENDKSFRPSLMGFLSNFARVSTLNSR